MHINRCLVGKEFEQQLGQGQYRAGVAKTSAVSTSGIKAKPLACRWQFLIHVTIHPAAFDAVFIHGHLLTKFHNKYVTGKNNLDLLDYW